MDSSSSCPNNFNLNDAPTTTSDAKVWRPSFVSQNRHLTVNDSVMMNDATAVTVARNFIIPMDEMLLTGRSEEEAINDSMASSIQSAASVSNLADRLRVRANEVQKLTTENYSLQRMLHESQKEVEKLKGENNSLLKLVSSYSVDTQRKLDMLQVSNERILGDHERLMARLKKRRPLPSEASRT